MHHMHVVRKLQYSSISLVKLDLLLVGQKQCVLTHNGRVTIVLRLLIYHNMSTTLNSQKIAFDQISFFQNSPVQPLT